MMLSEEISLNLISNTKPPSLVIDNFLSSSYLDHSLGAVKLLKSGYSRHGYNNKKTIRDHLDPRFCGTQYITNPRNILFSVFSVYFWNVLEDTLIGHGDYTFKHACFTQHGTVLLSAYSTDDFYGPHVDVDMDSIVTAVLMLSFTPIKGGELILDGFKVPFKNNRLVVFPSCVPHEVAKVETISNDYMDSRFTLQYFISAVPLNKPNIDESNNF